MRLLPLLAGIALSATTFAQNPPGTPQRPSRAEFEAAKKECVKFGPPPKGGEEPSGPFADCMASKGFKRPTPEFKKAFHECGQIFGLPKRPNPPSEAFVGCMTRKGFPPPGKPVIPPKGK